MARIEALTKEAVSLPKEQRLALARALLNIDTRSHVAETEQSWDEEIRARIKAVDEGHVTGIACTDLQPPLVQRDPG